MVIITKKGFTLAEIMVTAVILVIALGSLLFTFSQCLLLNEGNSNLVIALNDAQVVLEQIRGEPFANIDNFCATYNPATFANLGGEVVTCTVVAMGVNFRDVDVRIDWQERQRPRDATLSTTFSTAQ